MPSKKKKYNARFPPARIKKIMQSDEEVGKVAQAVPVIISRALELFVESLLKKAEVVTVARNAKTLTPSHLKQCILAEQRFDFLKDIVESIPDVQGDEECGTPCADTPRSSSSNSPFTFPIVSRSNSIPGPSSLSTAPSTPTVVSSNPVINEPPPVIVSTGYPSQQQQCIQKPFADIRNSNQQQQYESVLHMAPSVIHSTGVIPYVPAQLQPVITASSNLQQQDMQVRVPVLSHFEYIPNNLNPATQPSNNGIN